MRFMVIVQCNPEYEAGTPPSPELLDRMGRFNEEMVKAGVMLAAEGLQPASKGTRIRYDGQNRTVLDGPFTEVKEAVGGFWILQVRSKEEAVEWIKRAPFEDGEVELRQIAEFEDFGDLPPELIERRNRMQAKLSAQQ